MITQAETTLQETLPQNMKIGLFIPCYIDLVYPEVGIATLQLLERFGLNVGYPLNQTCCGQPMSNSGDEKNAQPAERLFVDNFKDFDCIVGPAGSCVKRYKPSLLVTVSSCGTCSALLFSVTLTPGSAAPLGSVTVPSILAVLTNWAAAGRARHRISAISGSARHRLME